MVDEADATLPKGPAIEFLAARDALIRSRADWMSARCDFRWPKLHTFNWVHDYFDHVARNNDRCALRIVDDRGADEALSFAQLARRSIQVAHFLRRQGIRANDRVLVMLGNVTPLWEIMLALIRMGAVIAPATTLLQSSDLADRLDRGRIKAAIADLHLVDRFAASPASLIRISVGGAAPGWAEFKAADSESETSFAGAPTRANDLLFLYFTSGTTAQPKLVAHTHASYPVGHLSTMFWLGLQNDDIHLNLSSPGWAKHAWSSFFAPWNAEATIVALRQERFRAPALLDQLVRCQVTSFCAPPTVWRMLIQEPLAEWKVQLRQIASAGEPLNAEIAAKVRSAWGLELRDGFGQTETTALIGNSPKQQVKPASMGRALPGYNIALLTEEGTEGEEGEICVDMRDRPAGLMHSYVHPNAEESQAVHDRYYHTGDLASRDADGYYTYIGRKDDVFKSSDYRISPFELESLLIKHPAVVEAAVIPCPDPRRLAIPKAYIVLAQGFTPSARTAQSIFEFIRQHSSPYKRIRRIEFAELPKTVSGKIRRADLRRQELDSVSSGIPRTAEFAEESFFPPSASSKHST